MKATLNKIRQYFKVIIPGKFGTLYMNGIANSLNLSDINIEQMRLFQMIMNLKYCPNFFNFAI